MLALLSRLTDALEGLQGRVDELQEGSVSNLSYFSTPSTVPTTGKSPRGHQVLFSAFSPPSESGRLREEDGAQGPGGRCRRVFVWSSLASAIGCAFAAEARHHARFKPYLESCCESVI